MKSLWSSLSRFDVPSFSSTFKIHSDGFTIPNIASFRLGNIPKNLDYLAQCLASLGKLTPLLIFTPWMLPKVTAQYCDQDFPASYNDIYLISSNSSRNHSENSVFWIKKVIDLPLSLIDGVCNFFIIPDKPPGDYILQDCVCSVHRYSAGNDFSWDKVIIYGQNVSPEALECLRNFIRHHCHSDIPLWAGLLVLLSGAAGCLFTAFRFCRSAPQSKIEIPLSPMRPILREVVSLVPLGMSERKSRLNLGEGLRLISPRSPRNQEEKGSLIPSSPTFN